MPSSVSFFSYFLDTPASMFFICAAVVPHKERANFELLFGVTVIAESAIRTVTKECTDFDREPSGPFTVTTPLATDTSVFSGIAMLFLRSEERRVGKECR